MICYYHFRIPCFCRNKDRLLVCVWQDTEAAGSAGTSDSTDTRSFKMESWQNQFSSTESNSDTSNVSWVVVDSHGDIAVSFI